MVEKLTDIRINHFVVIDFNGFRKMVDALGGVEVCVPKEVNDDTGHIYLPAGTYDERASEPSTTCVCGCGHNISDNGDIGRMKRQQTFLASMANKAVSAAPWPNPVRLVKFLDAAPPKSPDHRQHGLSSLNKLGGLAKSLRESASTRSSFLTVPSLETTYQPDPTNRCSGHPRADRLCTASATTCRINQAVSPGDVTTAARTPSGSASPTPSGGPSASQKPEPAPSASAFRPKPRPRRPRTASAPSGGCRRCRPAWRASRGTAVTSSIPSSITRGSPVSESSKATWKTLSATSTARSAYRPSEAVKDHAARPGDVEEGACHRPVVRPAVLAHRLVGASAEPDHHERRPTVVDLHEGAHHRLDHGPHAQRRQRGQVVGDLGVHLGDVPLDEGEQDRLLVGEVLVERCDRSPAAEAIARVLTDSTPLRTTISPATSRIRCTRSRLRACCGTRRFIASG